MLSKTTGRPEAGRQRTAESAITPLVRQNPEPAAATLYAIASQFSLGGTEALENPHVFEAQNVRRAGGLAALKALGKPATVLRKTKQRLFAA